MVARTRLAPERFRKITRRLLLSRSPYWRGGDERTSACKHRSLLRKIDQRAGAFRSVFRLVGGRRNIYVWILVFGLICGTPVGAFKLIAWWEAVTAAIQLARVAWALWALRRQKSAAG